MSWNWDHLRYFIALGENQTLTSAAEQLNVSHTTILRRIKSLESELQCQLFEHTHEGYRLNKNGVELYSDAKKMEHSIHRISQHIANKDQEAKGKVTITTTDTLAHDILPPILSVISESYPDIQLELEMLNQKSNIDNYDADIAIRACPKPPDKLLGRCAGNITFALCASRQYALAKELAYFPENTECHRIIAYTDSLQSTPFYQWLNDHVSKKSTPTLANSLLVAKSLCEAGMGITMLPEYLLNNAPNLIRLKTNDNLPTQPVWVISHPDSRNTLRVKLVRQLLFQELYRLFSKDKNQEKL